ncbi:NmrA family NAD(P)-binding protein [Kribbella sp. CA-293567]|uniref:NmrA family NAD(P)-binding protein n=1 Tax=Kribbella sp. CA-293567 TaxID=3002436 RepID=UPI0022DD3384|nr:NAD(P)H-binding protein [Kribbella sp. CA-293567]WBQ08488.1 NAD(P)H-binding protein [Kribbella sp. CA-293567]
MTILVLAATGKTGRRLVPQLRADGNEVRAASRSGEARFDWNEPETWAAVLAGVRAVYLVAPEDPEPVEAFVAQAVRAGVERFVVLSGRELEQAEGRFGGEMLAAERAVAASGVGWTVLRSNNFNQNFDEYTWREPLLAGRLGLPIGATGEPFIDTQDVAEVAALALTEAGHFGQVYELSGPESLTFGEAVRMISAALGRPIEYVELTPAEYEAELLAEGFPAEVAGALGGMFEMMREGLITTPTDTVEKLLGRPATTFAEYVGRVWPPH